MQPRWKLYPLACSYLLGLLLCTPASAQSYPRIDYPGAPNSFATDISDCGQIVGEYQYGVSFGKQRYGYLFNNGVFTPVIFPGSDWTRAVGVNCNGDIVGDYAKGVNNGNGQDFGFLLRTGVYTSIRFPNSDQTVPAGINILGDIVGWYKDTTGTHGFLLSSGIYTSIDFPGAAADTEPWKINDSGEIAGRYRSATDGKYYLFTMSNGSFNAIPDVPSSFETEGIEDGGLNSLGEIAGNYCSAKPCSLGTVGVVHGFLLSDGVYTSFDYPSSIWTIAFGLNSSDVVVGGYADVSGVVHG